ncbi:hypothetical protein BRAS3843_980032 [Bradyrhizobium sp. STM 3843]|nr:hypothetical protein BRAS3843_980032 [Bradyrhizobium sp. STM 3843]
MDAAVAAPSALCARWSQPRGARDECCRGARRWHRAGQHLPGAGPARPCRNAGLRTGQDRLSRRSRSAVPSEARGRSGLRTALLSALACHRPRRILRLSDVGARRRARCQCEALRLGQGRRRPPARERVPGRPAADDEGRFSRKTAGCRSDRLAGRATRSTSGQVSYRTVAVTLDDSSLEWVAAAPRRLDACYDYWTCGTDTL